MKSGRSAPHRPKMLREIVNRPPEGTEVPDEGRRERKLEQSSLRSRPIRHQRQVIEIRPLLATIVEEGPHRTVEPKALLLKQSRAVRTDSVTACAETDGRLACFLSEERKSVAQGKSASARVDLGGCSTMKRKMKKMTTEKITN